MRRQYIQRSLVVMASGVLLIASCKKQGNNDNPDVSPSSNVIVVNAAPSPAGYPALDMYLDTGKFTPAAIAYLGNNQATGITGNLLYAPALAADHAVDVRPTTTPNVKVLNANASLMPDVNYSFFIYDTLNNTTSQFKLLKLTDELVQPADTSMGKIRFLHLAPTLPAYDLTFVRLSGTTEVDSVTLTNRTYVGSGVPNEATLSAFTNVKGGVYRLKIKTAGTATVVTTINNAATNFLNFAKGKGYTVYVTGMAKGQPLALRTVRHF
ncbi:MAG: DUF4397 domain-containing protein [Chitinophagaceae bacterium]|nr:DUF4397 domain-containing protein [Chitinophagaceae bacterium]